MEVVLIRMAGSEGMVAVVAACGTSGMAVGGMLETVAPLPAAMHHLVSVLPECLWQGLTLDAWIRNARLRSLNPDRRQCGYFKEKA